MIKTALTAAAFSLLASAASAELLTCKTTQVSKSGFVNLAAAQSWFPEEFKIRISGEEAVSDFYGQGTANVVLDPNARDLGFSFYQESNGKIWWTMVTGDGSAALSVPSTGS